MYLHKSIISLNEGLLGLASGRLESWGKTELRQGRRAGGGEKETMSPSDNDRLPSLLLSDCCIVLVLLSRGYFLAPEASAWRARERVLSWPGVIS